MSFSVNKVTLLGHLGADPDVRSFQNGGKVCNIRVATAESWKDRQTGERKERTEWHNVSIFTDYMADYAANHLRKGSKVYLEGQIRTRKWQDNNGNDRYTTEIVLQGYDAKLIGLDGRDSNQSRGSGDSGRGNDGWGGSNDRQQSRGSSGGGTYNGGADNYSRQSNFSNDLDDEVPF